MSDGLRDALKKADFECVGKGGMFSEELDIFERHVRWWHGPIVDELNAKIDALCERAAEAEAKAERLRILVQRVSDMKEVSDAIQLQELLIDWNDEAEIALREIAEGKP
jgi:crotonobetainyl-CoA:carnitine CoA-transferase CaiB-like acyl-CoA transferase